MFEFFKSRKKPVKYKTPEEREHYLSDIQKRLSNQYQDVHFKFILLPAISKNATMVVKITHWKKKIGDYVKKNEQLAFIEVEKAQMELNADSNGIIVFRAEKNKELIQGDIFAIVADKYVDLEEFNFDI